MVDFRTWISRLLRTTLAITAHKHSLFDTQFFYYFSFTRKKLFFISTITEWNLILYWETAREFFFSCMRVCWTVFCVESKNACFDCLFGPFSVYFDWEEFFELHCSWWRFPGFAGDAWLIFEMNLNWMWRGEANFDRRTFWRQIQIYRVLKKSVMH